MRLRLANTMAVVVALFSLLRGVDLSKLAGNHNQSVLRG